MSSPAMSTMISMPSRSASMRKSVWARTSTWRKFPACIRFSACSVRRYTSPPRPRPGCTSLSRAGNRRPYRGVTGSSRQFGSPSPNQFSPGWPRATAPTLAGAIWPCRRMPGLVALLCWSAYKSLTPPPTATQPVGNSPANPRKSRPARSQRRARWAVVLVKASRTPAVRRRRVGRAVPKKRLLNEGDARSGTGEPGGPFRPVHGEGGGQLRPSPRLNPRPARRTPFQRARWVSSTG